MCLIHPEYKGFFFVLYLEYRELREVTYIYTLAHITHIWFIGGCGLSEVHYQLEDFVGAVALEHAHGVVQQLLGHVRLVPSTEMEEIQHSALS